MKLQLILFQHSNLQTLSWRGPSCECKLKHFLAVLTSGYFTSVAFVPKFVSGEKINSGDKKIWQKDEKKISLV